MHAEVQRAVRGLQQPLVGPERQLQLRAADLRRKGEGGDRLRAPGTAVRVQLRRDGDTVALAVDDEGPPLPQGMEARLFNSMVSVRAGNGGEAPHLGLGLYIVRLIAAFHGGTARAANRDDGRGVVVTVTLPAAAGP